MDLKIGIFAQKSAHLRGIYPRCTVESEHTEDNYEVKEVFEGYFGKLFMTFIISMVPIVELRGAIPFATAKGLTFWSAMSAAVIGNMIPVPFIIIFIRKIFEWLRVKSARLDGIVGHFEHKAEKHSDKVKRYKFWGLFILVAIPLPGTGAWTGALVAAMLEMRLKDALPAIFMGVVAAGLIMAVFSYGILSITSF